MHRMPTTLLFSLEGMPDLDWEKLLQFQLPNGSFYASPSSTAFALMETKDENCLRYLNRVVEKFNGGGTSANYYRKEILFGLLVGLDGSVYILDGSFPSPFKIIKPFIF